MKKKVLILVSCLVMCLVCTACGAKEEEQSNEIIGSWTLSTIVDAEGNEYTLEEYCEANGVDSAGLQATYTFKDNGVGVADIGGIGVDFTYEMNDNTVTISVNGQSNNLTYEDDMLFAEDANSGMQSYFTK